MGAWQVDVINVDDDEMMSPTTGSVVPFRAINVQSYSNKNSTYSHLKKKKTSQCLLLHPTNNNSSKNCLSLSDQLFTDASSISTGTEQTSSQQSQRQGGQNDDSRYVKKIDLSN